MKSKDSSLSSSKNVLRLLTDIDCLIYFAIVENLITKTLDKEFDLYTWFQNLNCKHNFKIE